jgi:hypothetical protein
MNQSEKLKEELAALERLLELSRKQPEAVAKIHEMEGQYRQTLAQRHRWQKEHAELKCACEQLRKTVKAMPDVATARDLSFDRIAPFAKGVTPGAAAALRFFDQQTEALRDFSRTGAQRVAASEARVRRAKLFLEENDNLAHTLAAGINQAKSELRSVVKASGFNLNDPGVNAEIRWLRADTQVPALPNI